MNDCFSAFVEDFTNGQTLQALQKILIAPESPYDLLSSQHAAFRALVNYVDAAVFEAPMDALHAGHVLSSILQEPLEEDSRLQKFLQIMHRDEAEKILILQNEGDVDAAAFGEPLLVDSWRGFSSFKRKKPDFASLVESSLPWYSFQYSLPVSPIFLADDGEIPLIVLEPCAGDYSQFLKSYAGKPSLFLFETKQSFIQMLQYPSVVKSLADSQHLLYIMELYPEEQWSKQPTLANKNFRPILFSNRPILAKAIPVLIQALQSGNSDWLYQASKQTLFAIKEWRLGKSRAAALMEKSLLVDLEDPHKGSAPKGSPLGPDPQDFVAQRCRELGATRKARKFLPGGKIKLAHIVPQVVDGSGHAPTRLLESLIAYHDSTRFELILISTERLTFHPFEYPCLFTVSERSSERGSGFLREWRRGGIDVFEANENLSLEETAAFVTEILRQHQVDVAVFHGPDVINTFSAQMTDAPLRVMIEHGMPPSLPGFDLVIASSEDAMGISGDIYKRIDSKVQPLVYSVDVRARWPNAAPTKQELTLPEDSFVMTTISNHLDSRLNPEMCLAIAEILKRCPKAIYAPMGRVRDEQKLRAIFRQFGVNDRVHFLGDKDCPSHYARAMELYLNEFPLGSGLAILDAMAAGCPVVTMYDALSTQQARRYGGIYFGIDRAVKTGRPEEYVALACQLIDQPEMYREWRSHALKQYEARSNIKNYVATFEEIVNRHLEQNDKDTK